MSTAKLQNVLRFCMGSHLLPIAQGPHLCLPCHRHVCRLCHTRVSDDEKHMLLDCFALADVARNALRLYESATSQNAQVAWLCLCKPGASSWSADTETPLHALIECHADDEWMLSISVFHPFSSVGRHG